MVEIDPDKKPFKEIYDSIARNAFADFEASITPHAFANLESPIEELFMFGILSCGQIDFVTIRHCVEFDLTKSREILDSNENHLVFEIYPQYWVAEKRVDFAIKAHSKKRNSNGNNEYKNSLICVECDGYAYHHGNPLKAARDKERDRKLSKHFDAIMRFTGSELHDKPSACAMEALVMCMEKLHD